ncbi:MAG: hypothetical protein LBQ90_05320 [Synergistaceae bacterium]|jgi:hypothetical protein|nr:hypothetical protein [Synergistaceae bacterium]
MQKIRKILFRRKILFKWSGVVLAAAFVFLPASGAWAAKVEDALSVRPDGAIYLSMRMDDLGGALKNIFSPENVEMVTSLSRPQDAGSIQLFASVFAQIPVKSLALAVGTTADGAPFLQLALSMPPALRSKLDLVSAGEAKAADIVTLLLGEGGLLLAAAVNPVLQKGEAGPYYTIEGKVALSARDDLLLMALSPQDLQDSLSALGDAKKRLALKRRFDSPNYYFLHADMPTAVALAASGQGAGETEIQNMKAILNVFKAPLEMETAFDSAPGRFLISCAINIFESMRQAARFKDLPPRPGADLFLAGEGKLLFGVSGLTTFSAADLKATYPSLTKGWESFIKEASKRGIAEKDIENLLTGSLSLVGGSNASILGRPAPGMYVALRGREGAASLILNAVLADPEFLNAVPVSPVKSAGWDTLVMVDPALIPVPLLLGVREETLFLGMIDPKGLDKKPEFSPKVAALLKEKLFAAGFFDTAAAWDRLRRELADPDSELGELVALLPGVAPDAAKILDDIMTADLGVSFIGLRSPSMDTSFVEFSLVDVPREKRLLPRLLKAAQALKLDADAVEDEDEESPLALLLAVRGAIEEEIAGDPDATPDDWAEEFSDVVTFVRTDAGLYIGAQVAGDDQKLELIENAEKFELTGSAGLGIAPDGNLYDGQEAVWIKIRK